MKGWIIEKSKHVFLTCSYYTRWFSLFGASFFFGAMYSAVRYFSLFSFYLVGIAFAYLKPGLPHCL